MYKSIFFIILFSSCLLSAFGISPPKRDYILFEYGVHGGVAHYFGDLNLDFKLKRPSYVAGIWARYNMNDYVALRASVSTAHIGFDDKENYNEPYMLRRNLNFESDLWEVALQGDFNFYDFIPKNERYFFTTYVTLGMGLFGFNPYTKYQGKTYDLRRLGTEGQDVSGGKTAYGNVAVCLPVGVGVKFNVGRYVNIGFELGYRLTTTDHIDDVSGTYAGSNHFSPGTPAMALQDRSLEVSPQALGVAGKQRGDTYQLDSYGFASFFITFNIIRTPACPEDNDSYKYKYNRSRDFYKNPR